MSRSKTDYAIEQIKKSSFRAEDLKKKKTAIKKTTNQLNKIIDDLKSLLTDKEISTLKEASKCLDLWVGRTEQAFKQKKEEQDNKELIRKNRTHKMKGRIMGDYDVDQMIRRAIIFSATLKGRFIDCLPVTLESIREELIEAERWKKQANFKVTLSTSIKGDITRSHRDIEDAICNEFGYSGVDFEELYEKFEKDYLLKEEQEKENILTAQEEVKVFRVKHRLIESNEE